MWKCVYMQRTLHFYRCIVLMTYASETWALKKVKGNGAPSNLGSPNNIRCEAAPAPHTTQVTQPACKQFPYWFKKPRTARSKRHVEATDHSMNHDRFYQWMLVWRRARRVPVVGGWGKVKTMWKFWSGRSCYQASIQRHVDEPSSCSHEISQLKYIIHTLPVLTSWLRTLILHECHCT